MNKDHCVRHLVFLCIKWCTAFKFFLYNKIWRTYVGVYNDLLNPVHLTKWNVNYQASKKPFSERRHNKCSPLTMKLNILSPEYVIHWAFDPVLVVASRSRLNKLLQEPYTETKYQKALQLITLANKMLNRKVVLPNQLYTFKFRTLTFQKHCCVKLCCENLHVWCINSLFIMSHTSLEWIYTLIAWTSRNSLLKKMWFLKFIVGISPSTKIVLLKWKPLKNGEKYFFILS